MNMPSNFFLILFVLCGQASVWSVRLVELRVPAQEREGSTALLGCEYDLEGETLYSVKWYKDEMEFFRYVPKNNPPIIAFKRPGVHVNITRSSSTAVALENLTRDSEGKYSCEVSGEGPSFATTLGHKWIKIHLLPENGPLVTGIQETYAFDEKAVINCTSSPSRPTAKLTWLINGQPAPESYLKGPWLRIPPHRPDAVETILQLRFIVQPQHFIDGTMKLECQATIAPMYQRETKSTHFLTLPFTVTEEPASLDLVDDNGTDSSDRVLCHYFLIIAILVISIAFQTN